MNSFVHAQRGRMTEQRALKVYQDADGKCAVCKRKLGPADSWDVDHVIALENGGTDHDDNLQLLCEWCHKPKTADDHAQAAHGRQSAVRAFVPKHYRRKGRW